MLTIDTPCSHRNIQKNHYGCLINIGTWYASSYFKATGWGSSSTPGFSRSSKVASGFVFQSSSTLFICWALTWRALNCSCSEGTCTMQPVDKFGIGNYTQIYSGGVNWTLWAGFDELKLSHFEFLDVWDKLSLCLHTQHHGVIGICTFTWKDIQIHACLIHTKTHMYIFYRGWASAHFKIKLKFNPAHFHIRLGPNLSRSNRPSSASEPKWQS